MKHDIQAQDLYRRIQSGEPFRIIDVRSPFEFALRHVPNSVNIPLGALGADLPGISPEENVVFVCQSGARSSSACRKVMAQHPNVLNLAGGMGGWMAAGLEAVSRPRDPRSVVRQTHLVASVLILAAFGLARSVSPSWIYLALVPAFGLAFDALTGICPMTLILKRMPWNVPVNPG